LAGTNGNDFQQNQIVYILNKREQMANPHGMEITEKNIIETSIYFTIRHIFEHTWINHNDQFLYPKNEYKNDTDFKKDSLVFTLFHGKNNIQSKYSVNHWIPFTAQEVGAKNNFKSDFMSNYIKDKKFSKEAKNTINAGKELWKYYHLKINSNDKAIIDASFYDIREFFQGRSKTKGTMKQKSDDETYNTLINNLRLNLSVLAEKIQPKVYEYGFLVE
jgi:hypothetical protein